MFIQHLLNAYKITTRKLLLIPKPLAYGTKIYPFYNGKINFFIQFSNFIGS